MTMPNEKLYEFYQGPDFVWIVPKGKDDMKRIVGSLVTQLYWFTHLRYNNQMTLIFHRDVDLEHLEQRLAGVKFSIIKAGEEPQTKLF